MNKSLRQEYLEIIGIQSWQLKSASDQEVDERSDDDTIEPEQPAIVTTVQNSASVVTEAPVVESVDSVLVEAKSIELNTTEPFSSESRPTEALSTEPVATEPTFDTDLVQSILSCQKCPSRTNRLNALVGHGSTSTQTDANINVSTNNASIFIISDAPNADEDRSGQYMAGSAQLLFDRMLQTIGLDHDYFLTGIVKCHSLEEYLVSESDLNNCSEFLYAQLEQIKPNVVIVLGAAQAQAILKTSQSFNELRGKIHNVRLNQTEYPVIVTYHPAYLLRNPLFKKEAMADLIRIKTALK